MGRKPLVSGVYGIVLKLFVRLAIPLVIIALGLYWGRFFEALLVLVTFLQFELAYRQYWLSKTLAEPVFTVDIVEVVTGVAIEIRNVGSTPAYTIGVSRVLCGRKPLPPEQWKMHVVAFMISYLKPESKTQLALVDKNFYVEYLNKKGCCLEVYYVNRYSEWGNILVSFYNNIPMIIDLKREPPGLLLSIPTCIRTIKAYFTIRRSR